MHKPIEDEKNLDDISSPGDREEDREEKLDIKSANGDERAREIPRVPSLRDPDTLDKHKLVSNRYREYR